MSAPRNALSLIELVIVSLIISIVTATAAPSFMQTYKQRRVDAAAMRIKADLRLARQTAITKSKDQTVVFDSSANSYQLSGMADADSPSRTYEVNLEAAPYEVKLFADGMGNNGTVVFNMYGKPDWGGTANVFVAGYSQTVTLNQEDGSVTVP